MLHWIGCHRRLLRSMRTPGGRRSRQRAVACIAAAGLVHHPLGTAADAADHLQHAVPLVRRAGDGRPVWDVTVFTENRDRLLEGDIARGFLAAILADPAVKPLLSTEHFSVDGTNGLTLSAWPSTDARSAAYARSRACVPVPSSRSIPASPEV
jgi:hypothetical protein